MQLMFIKRNKMKYLFLSVVLLLTVTTAFVGCGDSSDPANNQVTMNYDSTQLKSKAVGPLEKPITLKYALKKDEVYNYLLTTVTTEKQINSMGDSSVAREVKMTKSQYVSVTVKEVEANGVFEVSVHLKKVKIEYSDGKQTIKFTTGEKTDSSTEKQFVNLGALTSAPFSARVSERGEIKELYRVDDIFTKLTEALGIKDSLSAAETSQYKEQLVQTELKPLVAAIFKPLPENAIGQDQTWDNTPQPLSNQVFTLATRLIYKAKEMQEYKGDMLLYIKGSIEQKAEINPEATKAGLIVDVPKVIADADLYFNVDRGVYQKSLAKTSFNAGVSQKAPTPQGVKMVSQKQSSVSVNILELMN